MNSSLAGIVSAFQTLKKTEQEFVLATIVETSGSTYRKAGARMLITRAGQFYGLLGGGCFEADLLEHAYKVFASKQSNTIYYDMRAAEDLVWGLGLGCNGAVRIRLEYLSPDNNFTPLSLIETALTHGQRTVILTICNSDHQLHKPDQHYAITEPGTDTNTAELPQTLRDLATTMLVATESGLQTILADDAVMEVFTSPLIPPLRLAIIGAGPDAVPVTEAAKLLGWDVTVIDYRESCTRPDNFPFANRIINSTPEQLPETVDLHAIDAVVLMTHKYEYDLRYLRQLAIDNIRYIGLLGPAARRKELLKTLDQGMLDTIINRVYGPVGLDIGGELPEEIALSLIAEIQAVICGRDGGHLSAVAAETDSNTVSDKFATVILAAGGSTRFGAMKQLLEFNGSSFLKRTVEMAVQLQGQQVLVVHGPKATKCQRELSNYPVTNLVNTHWQTGQSSSLKLALDAVAPECEAILILLCDQPLVRLEHLQQLISVWSATPDKIIASAYAGTSGVPAIIPRRFFSQIKHLSGDKGAKKIISGAGHDVIALPVPEAEYDIDTEADFAELLARKPEY